MIARRGKWSRSRETERITQARKKGRMRRMIYFVGRFLPCPLRGGRARRPPRYDEY